MDTFTVSPEQAELVLERSEGHFSDVKSKRISPAKLSQTIAAFANADGGEVHVGIEDARLAGDRWDGFANEEQANGLVATLTRLFPPGEVFAYSFLRCEGRDGLVFRLEVLKNPSVWQDTAGEVYVRRGAQNLRLNDREDVRRLEYNKGAVSFEDSKLDAADDLFIGSQTLEGFLENVVPTADPPQWLRKQRLVIDDKATVAGAVLFSDEPQVILPKAAIKLYRYRTSGAATRETLESQPETIEGSAYAQIKLAVKRVVEIVEKIPVMRESGFEAIRYPDTAIHEVITNAVIHRDYSINDDVHIRIFDNRIEIFSPGRLPGHVTVKNILDERYARNQKVVRILNKFPDPPNKDVGEGLNAAFEAMRELQLKEPQIEEAEAGVFVALRHEKLAKPEQTIAAYLREHDEINNTTARGITFIGSENAVKRIFQKMVVAGIIERIPGRPQAKTAYRKGPKFPNE
jgi:ATP-dependent DNA helicase RecG